MFLAVTLLPMHHVEVLLSHTLGACTGWPSLTHHLWGAWAALGKVQTPHILQSRLHDFSTRAGHLRRLLSLRSACMLWTWLCLLGSWTSAELAQKIAPGAS